MFELIILSGRTRRWDEQIAIDIKQKKNIAGISLIIGKSTYVSDSLNMVPAR